MWDFTAAKIEINNILISCMSCLTKTTLKIVYIKVEKNRLICLQILTKSAAKVILYSANFVVEGKTRGNPFNLAFCTLFDCDCSKKEHLKVGE